MSHSSSEPRSQEALLSKKLNTSVQESRPSEKLALVDFQRIHPRRPRPSPLNLNNQSNCLFHGTARQQSDGLWVFEVPKQLNDSRALEVETSAQPDDANWVFTMRSSTLHSGSSSNYDNIEDNLQVLENFQVEAESPPYSVRYSPAGVHPSQEPSPASGRHHSMAETGMYLPPFQFIDLPLLHPMMPSPPFIFNQQEVCSCGCDESRIIHTEHVLNSKGSLISGEYHSPSAEERSQYRGLSVSEYPKEKNENQGEQRYCPSARPLSSPGSIWHFVFGRPGNETFEFTFRPIFDPFRDVLAYPWDSKSQRIEYLASQAQKNDWPEWPWNLRNGLY